VAREGRTVVGRVPGSGCRVPGAGSTVQDARCRVLRSWVREEHPAPRTRHAARHWITAALVLATIFTLVSDPAAHEIPTDVRIQAFLKPEGRQLRLLVRVPLAAIVDVDYPRRADGYLDLDRIDAALEDAAARWIRDFAELYEEQTHLSEPRIAAARVSLPGDTSFESYEAALAHVTTGERLQSDTEIFWEQGMLDVLVEYPIESDQSRFSIAPGLERFGMRVTTVLRLLPSGGAERAFEFHGDPGLVRLDPRWHQAALRFVRSGFFHILDGIDHLLFLFCLVIPFRRFGALVAVVTSFTIAHSITLIAAAYSLGPDGLWFPPLVETLIATSIVYMALENIVGSNFERRWMIAFGFGLIHGFGFSFALRETLQFAGSHLLTSLLSFNVGVELGQILVLVLLIPALDLLFRFGVAERIGTIILSALVAHTGWHWMIDRGSVLAQFPLPTLDAALVASAMRWMMVIVAFAGLIWLIGVLRQSRAPAAAATSESASRGAAASGGGAPASIE